jgi:hypothetical protein
VDVRPCSGGFIPAVRNGINIFLFLWNLREEREEYESVLIPRRGPALFTLSYEGLDPMSPCLETRRP